MARPSAKAQLDYLAAEVRRLRDVIRLLEQQGKGTALRAEITVHEDSRVTITACDPKGDTPRQQALALALVTHVAALLDGAEIDWRRAGNSQELARTAEGAASPPGKE